MTSRCRTVLIVDDDRDCVESMRLLLEDRGYDVATAYNGREALDFFETGHTACLVVLDLIMPVMTGIEFLAERQHLPNVARTPVIVVTATDIIAAQSQQQVLRKPVDAAALMREIDSFCA